MTNPPDDAAEDSAETESVSPPGGESPDPDAAPDLDDMKDADRAQDRNANVTEWR